MLAAIRRDKKVVDGSLHFVAAAAFGAPTTLTDVSDKDLKAALKAIGITKA